MANDVHYFIVISSIFMLLGIVAPLLSSELSSLGVDIGESEIVENDVIGLVPEDEGFGEFTVLKIILNFFTFAFWTFGLPVWFNVILLFFRLPLLFILARNVWVGGGS